jgi:hypothetical protein
MIKSKILYHTLSKKLIFFKMNNSRSKTFANRIDSLRQEFDKSGEVPDKLVKKFVRLNIELSIGTHLADKGLDKWIFNLEENHTLREAWFDSLNSYRSKRV